MPVCSFVPAFSFIYRGGRPAGLSRLLEKRSQRLRRRPAAGSAGRVPPRLHRRLRRGPHHRPLETLTESLGLGNAFSFSAFSRFLDVCFAEFFKN